MARAQTDRGTPFIGRGAELARLSELLAGGERLLTVTGAAGMGKSRLVRSLIERELESESAPWQGSLSCDLAGARSRADVVAALSATLDFHPSSGESGEASEDRLGHALAARGAVLVLIDTFDPVAEHAAGTLGRWIDLAPDARFLVTSRGRLRLRGEICLELGPLPTDEGVELFTRTAERARAGWSADPEDSDVLRELVERLDGIPLAIELGASRITILTPRKMLERLSKRFDLLRGGPSDAITRQHTLRAAFDWSWGMMSPAQQSALAQLSVFRGGLSIEAAEAVLDLGDEDVLDALEDLRGRSLLSPDPEGSPDGGEHFRLYDSIRDYAAERAEELAVLEGAEARHRDYFLEQAEARMGEFGAPDEGELAWLGSNRENLLAVVHRFGGVDPTAAGRAAVCLAHVMIRRGPFDATLEMLEGVLAALGEGGDPGLRCRLLLSRGVARSGVGRLEEGDSDLQAAAAEAQGAGMGSLEASARLHTGLNALRHGRLPESQALLEEARAAAEAAGNDRVRSRTLVSMGMCLEAGADFEAAEDCYRRALELAQRSGDSWEEVRTRSKMGSLCSFIDGREDEARSHFEWAWNRSQEVGDSFIEASTAYNLGRLNLNLGQLGEADRFLERALDNFREMGNRGSVGFVRTARGLLELERGNFEAARQELTEAASLLQGAGHRLALSYGLATEVLLDLVVDDLPAARDRAERALAPVVELQHGVLQGIVHCVRALVAARSGDSASFEASREQARGFLGGSGWGEGRAMLAIVDALDDSGGLPAQSVPDLDELHLARARVAWRLMSGEGATTAASTSGSTGAADSPAAEGELRVEPQGRWFQLGQAEVVDLSRKRTLRPLLLALIQLHSETPDQALDVDGVFEAVWPGERILPEAKKNRVYVAIATLRKTGLDAVLETRGDGYLLRSDLRISWA